MYKYNSLFTLTRISLQTRSTVLMLTPLTAFKTEDNQPSPNQNQWLLQKTQQ